MAGVFLSYSQRDRRRVRPIVNALEEAGLSVWWDRRILGGSQFSNCAYDCRKAAQDAVAALKR